MDKCVFCVTRTTLIDFNDETFKNYSLKLVFRNIKNFEYNDVELTNASLDFVDMGHFMGDLQSKFFFSTKYFFCLLTSKIIDTFFFFNLILENFEI